MDWKKIFREYLETCDRDPLNIEKAQILKIANLPRYLYKYRQVNKYSINNLEEDTVWINSPSDYNDPFEFYENIDFKQLHTAITKKHFEELIGKMTSKIDIPREIIDQAKNTDEPLEVIGRALMKKNNEDDLKVDNFFKFISDIFEEHSKKMLSDKLQFMQESMRVSSFCENHNQFLMWSHYADSHKGFCIEYDLSLWKKGDLRKRILFPVVYQDYAYNSTPHLLKSIYGEDLNNLYPIISGSTKSSQWEYEKEWRFIIPVGNSFPRQNYPMHCQSRVILGSKISEDNKKMILDICTKKNLPVFKANLSEGYSLKIEKI